MEKVLAQVKEAVIEGKREETLRCFLQVLFPCFCRHLLQQPPRGIYV